MAEETLDVKAEQEENTQTLNNPFLEESVVTRNQKNEEERQQDYIYTYSGNPLDIDEIFQYSVRNRVKMVIVAGEQGSGKTTLEIMMYRMFLEGKNESLKFAGTVTMRGFQKKTEPLLKKSGKEEQKVARTLRADKKFLNLSVCDKNKHRVNLLFSDYAGELFGEESSLEEIGGYFENTEKVIVTIDGQKVCDLRERKAVFYELKMLIRQLMQYGILTERSYLYVICTKNDIITALKEEKRQITVDYINENYEKVQKAFSVYVKSMKLIYLSALDLENREECKKLEMLLNDLAFDTDSSQNDMPRHDEMDLIRVERQYDKFKVR